MDSISKLLNEAKRLSEARATGSRLKVGSGASDTSYLDKVAKLAAAKEGKITGEDLSDLRKYTAKQVASAEKLKDSTLDKRIKEYDTYYDMVTQEIERELRYASAKTVALKNGWSRFSTVHLPEFVNWYSLPMVVRTGTWNNSTETYQAFNYCNIHCGFWDHINPSAIFEKGVNDDYGNTVEEWFNIVFKGAYYMERDEGFIVFSSEWNAKSDLSPRYTEDRMYKK